jgi:hypothetical protein
MLLPREVEPIIRFGECRSGGAKPPESIHGEIIPGPALPTIGT